MELQGETIIAAPRARVWEALNDPAMLARCIEGVESLERTGENRFEGKLNTKVGPVRAAFTGAVTLSDLDPPNAYRISGEGKGGVAGFAKGSADVRLADETLEDGRVGTRLTYSAQSTVGGKLAQLGARLIEGTARAYAESFFTRLKQELEMPAAVEPREPAEPTEPTEEDSPNVAVGSDTGEAVAAAAEAAIQPHLAPTGPLPPVEAGEGRGLSPLVWGSLIVLLTIIVLLFFILR